MAPAPKNHVTCSPKIAKHQCAHTLVAQVVMKQFNTVSRPVTIAVGGPGGTGKSTFARQLADKLPGSSVLGLDDYKTPRSLRAKRNIFGPHPEANELALIETHLETLRQNRIINRPQYCSTAGRINSHERFSPTRFIIVEGETATYPEFHAQVDLSVFIDAHWKTQLNTRITRDIEQRGYTPEKAIATFLHSNLREFAEYGSPTKDWADIHIHCDESYALTIDAICPKLAKSLPDQLLHPRAR